MMEAVEDFYGKYYFRPRIVARIVKKAIFDSRNAAVYKRLPQLTCQAQAICCQPTGECSICIGVAALARSRSKVNAHNVG